MEYDIKGLLDLLHNEQWNTRQDYGRRIKSRSGVDMYLLIRDGKPAFRFLVSQNEKQDIKTISPRNGFEISFEDSILCKDDIACLILPRRGSNLGLFLDFVRDLVIVAGESSSNLAVKNLIGRLAQWSLFFDKCPNGILSDNQQLGLLGELWFLYIFLEKGAFEIIKKWKGPESATKDFVFDDLAVEIKTTIRSDTNRIHISDENQLDDSGFSKLILCNLIFIKDELDGYTLPELIEEIRGFLGTYNYEQVRFNELLEKAGYRDVFAEMYDKSFKLENMFYYNVSEDFPRVIPRDLRNGVKAVSYNIELSFCKKYMIEYSQAESLILSEVQGNE